MMFVRDKREEIKRQNPNATFGDLAKMQVERWKAMSEDEKAPFMKQSEEDKARYLKEKQEYDAGQDKKEESKSDGSSSEEESKPKEVGQVVISPPSPSSFSPHFFPSLLNLLLFVNMKVLETKKEPNAPMRPMSAYMMFVRDKREEVKSQNPNAPFGEIGKLLGNKWKDMTETERETYAKQSEEEKARYLKEKQAYDARQSNQQEDSTDDDEEESKSDESSSEEESKPKKVCYSLFLFPAISFSW